MSFNWNSFPSFPNLDLCTEDGEAAANADDDGAADDGSAAEDVATAAKDRRRWNFSSNLVFPRVDKFLARIYKVRSLYVAVIEFEKLDKTVVGG